jgi:hypothetical protein
MGYSECIFEKVLAKRLRFKVTGVNGCHISLRCPECDMSDLPTYCKPKSAPDYSYCPFFDVDTFDLEPEFELIAAPALRALSPKSG